MIDSVMIFSVIGFCVVGLSLFCLWILVLLQDKRISELEGESERMICLACGKEKRIFSDNVCKECFDEGIRLEKFKEHEGGRVNK